MVSGSGGFGPLRSGWEMGGPSVGIVWWLPFFHIKLTLMVSTWWGWGSGLGPLGLWRTLLLFYYMLDCSFICYLVIL